MFSKEDKGVLDDLLNIQKHIGKQEFNQMFIPQTGAQVQMTGGALTLPAAAAYGMKQGGYPGGVLGAATLIGGARGLKSALMSDALKKMYLKGLTFADRPTRKIGAGARLGLPIMGAGGEEYEQ
jgi:hypothetical protein